MKSLPICLYVLVAVISIGHCFQRMAASSTFKKMKNSGSSRKPLGRRDLELAKSPNIIGIDFSSDSIKVAIGRPDAGFDIVTNFQSKRKTPSCISFNRGDRLFGSDAMALMARKPEVTCARATRLLGRHIHHNAVQELRQQYFPYEIYSNKTTKQINLKVEDTHYAPEELAAMLLQHVHDICSESGSSNTRDCVITIPSYYTQHERQAMLAAAEIAGLTVLSLVEDNTAAAVNYCQSRTFDQPVNILFFNMGAGATQATVATCFTGSMVEGGKNITQFKVIGKGWDESLGGINFDVKLAELLADRFNAANRNTMKGSKLQDFVRPMTKLRLEANKVKEVLSANKDCHVKIESLHDDLDLQTKVSRFDFEACCSDLLSRATTPIDKALAMANMTAQDLSAVELLGGSVRVPAVRGLLESYFKGSGVEIGQHLNGDEAMALGAAYTGACTSAAFRNRRIFFSEVVPQDVSVHIEPLSSGDTSSRAEEAASISDSDKVVPMRKGLFDRLTRFGTAVSGSSGSSSSNSSCSRTIEFPCGQDLQCRIELNSGDLIYDSALAYDITGLNAFAKEIETTAATARAKSSTSVGTSYFPLPTVQLTFALDSSGIIRLTKAEATAELPNTDEVSTANSSPTGTMNTDVKVLRKTLLTTINHGAVTPSAWTPFQIAESRSRLRALRDVDDQRRENAVALNDLETYIYAVKNRLIELISSSTSLFSSEAEVESIVSEDELKTLLQLANSLEEWLYNDGQGQIASVYASKQEELIDQCEGIFSTVDTYTELKRALADARQALSNLKEYIGLWISNTAAQHNSSLAVERQEIFASVAKTEEWLKEKETAVSTATKAGDAFPVTVAEVYAQLKSTEELVTKVISGTDSGSSSNTSNGEEQHIVSDE